VRPFWGRLVAGGGRSSRWPATWKTYIESEQSVAKIFLRSGMDKIESVDSQHPYVSHLVILSHVQISRSEKKIKSIKPHSNRVKEERNYLFLG
jgi:hypothetical protein